MTKFLLIPKALFNDLLLLPLGRMQFIETDIKIFPAVLTSNFRPYSLGAWGGLDTSTQSLGEVNINEVTSSAVNR